MPIADSFGQLQGFRNQIAAQNAANYFGLRNADRNDAQLEEAFLQDDNRQRMIAEQRAAEIEAQRYFRNLQGAQTADAARFRDRQFQAGRDDAAFNQKYANEALVQSKADHATKENDALFGQLYNEINRGNISDLETLDTIEGGRLSSDQYSALRSMLGNAQVRQSRGYFNGAVENAGNMTAALDADPNFLPSKEATKPIRDAYFNDVGVYPEQDPMFMEDYARSLLPKGSKYFGWLPGVTSTDQAKTQAAALEADIARRHGYFNTFAGKALKGKAGQDVVPDVGNMSFQPRNPNVAALDAAAYATAPDAREYFQTSTPDEPAPAKGKGGKKNVTEGYQNEAAARAAGYKAGDEVIIVENGKRLRVQLQ